MYQKWPDQIFPVVNFVFSRDGHFGLGRGGRGFGGGVPPPLVFNYSKEALGAGGLGGGGGTQPPPVTLPGVIVFLMNARDKGGGNRGGGGIGQPFVQFCFRRFAPSVVCSVFSVPAYFPLMDIDLDMPHAVPDDQPPAKKERGTALFDADVEEVTGSKVS